MHVVLFIIGIIALLVGALVGAIARTQTHSAIHEIEALILFLIAVVGLGFGALLARKP